MSQEVYRYRFCPEAPVEEIEATLVLAVLSTEGLHGESLVRLNAAHYFDVEQRACVIDAGTTVGQDLNCLFVNYLDRRFGADSFSVERLTTMPSPVTAS